MSIDESLSARHQHRSQCHQARAVASARGLDGRTGESLFIAAATVAEIWRGVLEKPRGRKRDELEGWFSGPQGPQSLFAGRILPFDEKAGLVWGRLMAEGAV